MQNKIDIDDLGTKEARELVKRLIGVLKWLEDYIGEENDECLKLIEITLKKFKT